MKRILPPRFEWQDGWVYIRVKRLGIPGNPHIYALFNPLSMADQVAAYADRNPNQRVISSKRTERAVQIDGYLERCREEGLVVSFNTTNDGGWSVGTLVDRGTIKARWVYADAETLAEAYWRCRQKLDGTYGKSKKARIRRNKMFKLLELYGSASPDDISANTEAHRDSDPATVQEVSFK